MAEQLAKCAENELEGRKTGNGCLGVVRDAQALFIVGCSSASSDSCQESVRTRVGGETEPERGSRRWRYPPVSGAGEAVSGAPCRMKMWGSLFKKQKKVLPSLSGLLLHLAVVRFLFFSFFCFYLMVSSLEHRDTAEPHRCLWLHHTTGHVGKMCLTLTLLHSGSGWWQRVTMVIRCPRTFLRKVGPCVRSGAHSSLPLDFSHTTHKQR